MVTQSDNLDRRIADEGLELVVTDVLGSLDGLSLEERTARISQRWVPPPRAVRSIISIHHQPDCSTTSAVGGVSDGD